MRNAINVEGQICVILKGGKFGRIRIDETGNFLFDLLTHIEYEVDHGWTVTHFLFQN